MELRDKLIEKKTGAQAQSTNKAKGAVATAGKKHLTKSWSRAVTCERGEAVSTQQDEQKESISTSTNKALCISVLGTKGYLFDCYYANAQSLNNEMDEFREVVMVLKPKVSGITESCSEGKSEGDINLEDLTPYRDDRRGGVIFHTENGLQSALCTELNTMDFESSVWSIITLNKRDNLLVVCIYKSKSSTVQNTNMFISVMNKAVEKHGISHLLIFGDFNFPEIDWKSCLLKGSDDSLPAKLIDTTQDFFLKQ